MLEILYRIYEVPDSEIQKRIESTEIDFGLYSSTSKANNIELLTDCLICDTREQFKEIIREEYGKDIPFRYNKKFPAGTIYCIIIGEHCYNTERYFSEKTFVCDCCGATVKSFYTHPIAFFDSEIKWDFYGIKEYESKRFCSQKCKEQYKNRTISTLRPSDDSEFWISRDSLKQKGVTGWIYKITKKSTGEFYVGQTIHAPIFRWGQHLKTERFPIENILDYKFEVIEVVSDGENILDREKYWIQKCYTECPEKSLNIAQTKNISENFI